MHLIIMGAPGAGKGTYCQDLCKVLNVPHISTGDMFRKAIKDETPIGKLAKELIDKGQFVPDEVTNKLVEERLNEKDCENGFILDGYPRNVNQAEALEKILSNMGAKLDSAINLDVDYSIIVNRMINRRICPSCGASYNLISIKPIHEGICDKCGTSLIQRDDDKEETIKTRLDVYEEQTKPLIEFYKEKNLLNTIDSNGSIKEVFDKILKSLEDK